LPGVRKTAFSLPADSPTELGGDATGSNSPSTDYDVGSVEGTVASSGVGRHWQFVAGRGFRHPPPRPPGSVMLISDYRHFFRVASMNFRSVVKATGPAQGGLAPSGPTVSDELRVIRARCPNSSKNVIQPALKGSPCRAVLWLRQADPEVDLRILRERPRQRGHPV
jgi:hypothetical protein